MTKEHGEYRMAEFYNTTIVLCFDIIFMTLDTEKQFSSAQSINVQISNTFLHPFSIISFNFLDLGDGIPENALYGNYESFVNLSQAPLGH